MVRSLVVAVSLAAVVWAADVPPLMNAAAFGSVQEMKQLLDSGADANARNSAGATALMWAAGDLGRMRLLVAAGADVNAVSKNGRSALLVAASQEDSLPLVQFLLDKGADVTVRDAAGFTALTAAAAAGNVETVRLLIAKGLDVNARTITGNTPLMGAANSGNVEVVRLLLAKGANPNAAVERGGQVRNGEIAFRGVTALMMAAGYGSAELVKTLLDAGAKVNAVDGRGLSALAFAVTSDRRDPRVPELLIARGADVNIRSKENETPLDWAKKANDTDMVRLLKGHGAVRGEGTVQAAGKPEPAENVGIAVVRSTKLMQRASASFFTGSGCAACHAQNLSQIAGRQLEASGMLDAKLAAEERKQVVMREIQERVLIRQDPGAMDIPLYMVFGLAVAGHSADFTTNSLVHYLASKQSREGGWIEQGQPRPPMNSSSMRATAMAVLSLRTYMLAGRRAEFEQRIERARHWAAAYECRTPGDQLWKVAALRWSGAGIDEVRKAADAVKAAQRADGGFAQTKFLGSDAFATGETLWVLHETGHLTPGDPVYQRAAEYLRKTQMADGSWHVRSRAIKFQPYFESGFPHGHDQWISQAATAWATAALAPLASRR